MGTSSGTETVTQNSEPWSAAQPHLRNIFSGAQGLYNRGAEYYPGSTVVPFSNQTRAGMQGLENQFSQSNPVGYDAMQGAVTGVAGSNQNNPFVSNIQNAGAQQNDAGASVLQSFANNGQNNPYLDARFDQAAERVRDNTSAIFSKAGRYGSVAHQDALSDSLGDMANNFYGQAYETDANRRFGAAEALGARQAGDLNRNLGAQQAAAGVQQGANSQALAAAGMVPGLHEYSQANNRGLIGLGAMHEGMAQQQLADSMNRWNFGQNAGWDLLNRYNAAVQPLAAMGGSSTGTQPSSQPSTLQTLGGLGMMGLGIFSDRRLKHDIKAAGKRLGHKWYSFRYNTDPSSITRYGVMAQDILETHPEAVMVDKSGYYKVNYSMLGLEPEVKGARKFIMEGTR